MYISASTVQLDPNGQLVAVRSCEFQTPSVGSDFLLTERGIKLIVAQALAMTRSFQITSTDDLGEM